MHSAVLQNKKYIQFAKKNSVEVIALGSLDRGIENGDPKAATYTGKDDNGNPVEYLLKYPGMTIDEMNALARSDARKYNKTGKIPYTSVVDPHTLKEVKGFLGGQSAKTIMNEISTALRTLRKNHGQGVSRDSLESVHTAIKSARALSKESDFAMAVKELAKATKKAKNIPESLQKELDQARNAIVKSAEGELKSLEALARVNPDKVKKKLRNLKRRFAGTGLEDRIEKLSEKVSS